MGTREEKIMKIKKRKRSKEEKYKNLQRRPASTTTAWPSHDQKNKPASGELGAKNDEGNFKGEKNQDENWRKFRQQRESLPIFSKREEIIATVRKHQSTVVVGETGSGKSTQITQYLYEAGFCKKVPGKKDRLMIVCTQPRRVAAITVARRVAAEAGCGPPGRGAVGYAVRFDDRAPPGRTRVKYATDGVLLREAMADPLLSAYGVLVLDEAHERSLRTDILFGLVRRLQKQRTDLKVVVMSATLDVALFSSYFPDSAVLHIPGRQHPVDVFYAKEPQQDYLDAALRTVLQIHEDELGAAAGGEGDWAGRGGGILVFLPGQEEIEALAALLRERLPGSRRRGGGGGGDADDARRRRWRRRGSGGGGGGGEGPAGGEGEGGTEVDLPWSSGSSDEGGEEEEEEGGGGAGGRGGEGGGGGPGGRWPRGAEVCPIYAALPQEAQLRAFRPPPPGCRKIVLATNIAETSITLDGIAHVVDCGFVKQRAHQATTGMEALRTVAVSRAAAHQRAGRAGRLAPGRCWRLYPEAAFEALAPAPTPEVHRVQLAQVVLQLKVAGVARPQAFPWLSAPPPAALRRALERLLALGALHPKDGSLTDYGRKMAALPLEPLYAHLLLQSVKYQCTQEVLTTVAMLSAENVFYSPPHSEQKKAAWEAHKRFVAYEGDLLTLNNIFLSWQLAGKEVAWSRQHFINHRALAHASEVRRQLERALRAGGVATEASCRAEKGAFLRCLGAGLFLNVAQRHAAGGGGGKGAYRTLAGGREVHIHPSSALFGRNPPPKTVLFTELLLTSKQYIRGVTAFEQSWLPEVAPQFFRASSSCQQEGKNI